MERAGLVADYRVDITAPGQYRLWIRWASYDSGSDSMYAQIVELADGPGGSIRDWYRYAIGEDTPDFQVQSWKGEAGPELTNAGPNAQNPDVPAVWDILAPGPYTIRLSAREGGAAVDTLLLQLIDLPDPTEPGPPESPFIQITQQPAGAVAGPGQTATFTIQAISDSPLSYQWQKAPQGSADFTDIGGATANTYTTPALTLADDGTKYRCVVSNQAKSLTSQAAVLTVDTVGPTLVSAKTLGNPNRVTVVFSEAIADPAGATFALDQGVSVSAVTQTKPNTVELTTTSPLSLDKTYTLTVNGIKDIYGNELLPNSQIVLDFFVEVPRDYGKTVHGFQDDFSGAVRDPNWVSEQSIEIYMCRLMASSKYHDVWQPQPSALPSAGLQHPEGAGRMRSRPSPYRRQRHVGVAVGNPNTAPPGYD